MKKAILFIKRKPGMTKQEFRDYYEARHAFIGPSLFGDIVKSFGRYYLDSVDWTKSHWDPDKMDDNRPPAELPFDVICIYGVEKEADFERFNAVFADENAYRVIYEDELNFMDRPACMMGMCDAVEGEGVFGEEGHRTRERLGLPAQP